ncbi:hypothetical protein K402DRAFT_330742 [Aulographum hederae CBS 113979]|uniref:Amino acid permease/ SLC12A domain-containing protein n=1 Tax=Aulographum hederae CBS 113979 TaxID=1176131 RepID=A0A6G1H2N4_9PEZI|nr:hypothetical protein K402DRAFT_330742 [Aulographum hederae CBS 113979]
MSRVSEEVAPDENAPGVLPPNTQLKREITSRQLNMMALAGSVGTGLIIGSGTALARGGPLFLIISYLLMGTVIWFVMLSYGEMTTYIPMQKGFPGCATRFVDPALGFVTGWNYFFKYAMLFPNNLTASGLIIQYWLPNLNVSIFVSIFGLIMIALNVMHVKNYGAVQFWLGCAKVVVMLGLIFLLLIISLGGSPSHHRTGFQYWKDPGPINEYLLPGSAGKLLGFWAAMVSATFAYTGCEVVGAAFGEVENPRRNIPIATRQTFYRIIIFYIASVIVITMAVPSTSEALLGSSHEKINAAASPFVIAVKMAGIPVLPDIINGSLLIFVLSAVNADVYTASRTLFAMSKDGHAPKPFSKTVKGRKLFEGVPLWAVGAASLWIVLGYMNATRSASQVFGYLVSLTTVFGALNWVNILVSYLCFLKGLKAMGIERSSLPYKGPFQPYGASLALAWTCIVVIFNGYDAFIPTFNIGRFLTCYIPIIIYLTTILGWKLIKKTKRVTPAEMELQEGAEALQDADHPGNQRFWRNWFAEKGGNVDTAAVDEGEEVERRSTGTRRKSSIWSIVKGRTWSRSTGGTAGLNQ